MSGDGRNAVQEALIENLMDRERKGDDHLRTIEERLMRMDENDPRAADLDRRADHLAGWLTDIDECLRLLEAR